MSLNTHSKFYYGYEISDAALFIDFNEGAGALFAELEIGSYSLTDALTELARALNDAGTLTYTVTVDRTTQTVTIAASGAVSLLVTSGAHAGTSAFGVFGFTGADRASLASHLGNAQAGSSYATQFIVQSYIGPDDYQDATYGTVNKSASGQVEVIRFGVERFHEFNLKYVNDRDHGVGGPIRYNATGIDDLRALMQYLVTKGPLEFMPDEDDPDVFDKVLLETTADDSKGLKYKLRELYGQNLPGYFETGALKFRVIE